LLCNSAPDFSGHCADPPTHVGYKKVSALPSEYFLIRYIRIIAGAGKNAAYSEQCSKQFSDGKRDF